MSKDLEFSADSRIAMAKEMEGYVYINFWISCFQGNPYTLYTDYYLVKKGIVFKIGNSGYLSPTKDTLLSVHVECKRLKPYAENDESIRSFNREISFIDLKKVFSKSYVKS